MGPVSIVLLLNTVQPLAFEIIFPFINQMILELGIVDHPEEVGFYSGLIKSLFSCMSFIWILPITRLSDYLGRKPVILCGVSLIAVSVVAFGMSKTFLGLVLTRCLAGAAGSSWALMRVMLTEMTDKSNQGLAFSSLTIAYRTSQIIGLPLGGFLAHPERHFALFQGPFWYEYPYALPCFVAAPFAMVGVVLGYFLLKETLRKRKTKRQLISEPTSGVITPTGSMTPNPEPPFEITVSRSGQQTMLRSILSRPVISLLSSTMAMCLVSEALFAVYPLFAFTPVHLGGLGVSEAVIGTQMSIRALIHLGVMLFYAPIERRLGAVGFYQLTMFTWPLVVLCYPLLSWLATHKGVYSWPFNVGLTLFFFIWAFGGFSWTASAVAINDVSPSAEALATINSLQQMSIVLPQAIAPASVTAVFAASIKSGIAAGNLIWIVLFAFTCLSAMHSLTLCEPEHDWRAENAPET